MFQIRRHQLISRFQELYWLVLFSFLLPTLQINIGISENTKKGKIKMEKNDDNDMVIHWIIRYLLLHLTIKELCGEKLHTLAVTRCPFYELSLVADIFASDQLSSTLRASAFLQ